MQDTLLTPRQAAAAVGVSESSVRRWCDQGRLPGQRTAGGHRRIQLGALLEFARKSGMQVSMAAAQGARDKGGRRVSDRELLARAHHCAMVGDDIGFSRLVADTIGSGMSLATVCDRMIAPVLHLLGEQWSREEIDIYQEHRATETVLDVLARASTLVPAIAEGAPLVVCCSFDADVYAIAPRMLTLAAREAGFRPVHLGPNTPLSSICRAISDLRPALVALSVSYTADEHRLVSDIRSLKQHCESSGTALAIGGRSLDEDVRRQVTADFFGDTMEHLRSFAASLRLRIHDREARHESAT